MADAPRCTNTDGCVDTDSDRTSSPSPEATFDHVPVMCDEIVALVAPLPPGRFLDATLGGAGHASAILDAAPQLRLLGIDRDPIALSAAAARLAAFGDRVRLERTRFDRIGSVLGAASGSGQAHEPGASEVGASAERLSGFLFDLGVSSPQIDTASRGFSFRHDGPLDMRMDPDGPVTAADVVNTYSHGEIASILKRNGDERFAGRIASAIVARRPFSSTAELAEVIVDAIPAAARRTGGHPAKRSFQALRIHVNDELQILAPALEAALDALVVGGRGLVLTYHSGEDRIVKDVFRGRSTVDIPPGIPVPATEPEFAVLRPLARRPTDGEIDRNSRAASARLRVIERRLDKDPA